MPSKYQEYRQMADTAERQLTSSYKSWTQFLRTAARLYKYPYNEQIMIHAQRPDATACAEYDFWNKKMGRFVRRGSTGIALIDTSGQKPQLRYVFDVADTGEREHSRPVHLWQFRAEHEDAIAATLERSYGVSGSNGIVEQMESAAAQLVKEYWVDNKRDILYNIDDSYLDGYDEFNAEVQFRNAAKASITYMLMSRCGLEPEAYRARTRFSKFFNLPELMQLFKEAADIKTADQLHLPTPTPIYHNVVAQPTEIQKGMVQELSERVARVHAGIVDASTDNMLKITSDGRKLGLDQRVINPDLPDEAGSKVNLCVDNIYSVWKDGQADKLTQLVFCDLSTPKAAVPASRAAKAAGGNLDSPELHALEAAIGQDTSEEPAFTIYDDIREKLVARGIPREQIAFIHEANTDAGRMARCTAPPAAGLDERKSILIEQARKRKSFRAIFLQRGLARGDHANHSHARQQGQDHCPMPDGTDGLRKESG